MDLYEELKKAGCEMDNHESDLYVKATEEARQLTVNEPNRSFFRSEIDGEMWIELPFRFSLWWEKKKEAK